MNMESLDLNASISAVSIIFGVLTYFLTMVYEKTKTVLEQAIPATGQVAARNRFRKELLTTLFVYVIPLLVAWWLLFYICLPTVIHIRRNSRFSPSNLDLLRTLFVFLEGGIAACSILALVMGVRLLQRWWRAR
jgi:hypothetical protein